MNPEPVVLINAFEVPAGADEAFLHAWERTRAFLATQEGYLSTRLHRSLSPTADFRFVNVAVWRSPAEFQAAICRPGFADVPVPFPAHPSLYQVVREDRR
jgi:heme-degrading monooxygenase HmoA